VAAYSGDLWRAVGRFAVRHPPPLAVPPPGHRAAAGRGSAGPAPASAL